MNSFPNNIRIGSWKDRDSYDHLLTFYIAGWLKNNLQHNELKKLSQNQIAMNIAEQIIKWVSNQDNYSERIQNIYRKYLHDIPISADISYIWGQCGKIYEEIFQINISCGQWKCKNSYDHSLAFYIAGWVKDNIKHHEIEKLSQSDIAMYITKQNITWIHGY